ncbi:unnamed protein product [Closterium sp. NIES-53]
MGYPTIAYTSVLAGFYREQGIRQSWTLPESPQQNGVAERRIGLVMDIARTSTIHARAPHFLWPYAVRYATHQLNLWPRVSRPGASPTSLWTGSLGDATHFRVWGCLARVRDTSADKISPHAIPCVFLGFLEDSQSPTTPGTLVEVSRFFLPLSALTASLSTPVTDYYRTYCRVLSRVLSSLVTDPHASLSSVSALIAAVTEFAATRRLDHATCLVAAPLTSPLAVGGESALGYDALEGRQFELEFLVAASPHLCAMLLASEGDPDALDIPTPRTYTEASHLRALGLSVESCHEVWLRRSSAFTGTFPPGTQWRLRQPVYGLRQAPHEWHDTLRSTMSDLGFQPSSADPSLFVRRGSTPFFVLVYIDDLVFATADRVALADMKAARTITLSQSHMVRQVLLRFELQHSTIQRTPLAIDHRLTRPFPDEPSKPSGPYAELVGCLIYMMICTRPNLAFPLSILAHFVVPGRHRPVHWTAAVRLTKYLATTSCVELVLGGTQPVVLTGHYDSSYADDAESLRSTQGYCFSLGSGAVSWRSTRSSSVSTSTAEAEIYARAMAAQELQWLTFLLTDLGERPSSAPTLFTDNKATILLYREP